MKLFNFMQFKMLKKNHKSKIQLERKINTLNLEIETLKQEIKDGLYKSFLNYCNEISQTDDLKKENLMLRRKNKELKEEIKRKENNYGKKK